MENDCKVYKKKVTGNGIMACCVSIIVIIGLISIAIGIDKANSINSVYNYPNAVVVDKKSHPDRIALRIKSIAENKYQIISVNVPHGEYVEFNIGDTIKCH